MTLSIYIAIAIVVALVVMVIAAKIKSEEHSDMQALLAILMGAFWPVTFIFGIIAALAWLGGKFIDSIKEEQ